MSNGIPALRLVGELPRSAELVVIGGGVIGAATAFFAGRAGLSTVVLEARPALATLTTPVSTGAFRLQFDNPEEIALVREGVAIFRDFAAITGLPGYEIGYREGGYLFCTTTEAGVERQRGWVAAQHGWGLDDVELLTGDEARYRFPYLSPEVRQARFRAGDGWLDPTRLTLGYAIASQAAVSLSTPAIGFLLSGNRVVGVRTPRGDVACEHVVVAAGPFAARVAAWAGVTLQVRPTRRQKMVLPELPAVPRDAPMTIDEETAAHWRPALAGAFALWTEAGTPPGEPMDDVPTTSDFAFGLLDPASPHALARISPFWAEVWEHGSPAWLLQAGQYDYTPDHRPYLGPTHAPGLHLNTGYSGHGIMAGAGGSRLVVDLLTGKEAPERNPFRPDRPMVERPLDIL
jgi:sarcosine oxidase subunit beta